MTHFEDLKGQILLRALSDRELEVMGERTVRENYPQGETIFQEGDRADGIYLIRRGKVEISKTTPDGWKQTLAVLTRNHFFGELSVVEDKSQHGADATALENSELFLIRTDDFRSLEQKHPETMYKIMKTIAHVASTNLHAMNDKLVKLLISY